MKALYYDTSSGISGDMNVAALLDLGVEFEFLRDELAKLGLSDEYEISLQDVVKNGIRAKKFDVNLKHHTHERSFTQICALIENSTLSERVKTQAVEIFTTIAKAEAKVHNKAVADIHFHEIGATDSIIDIVGACICFEGLGVSKIYASVVELGGGVVRCEHGELGVPVPAVCEILSGAKVSVNRANFEMTTPTGAGILATLCAKFSTPQDFVIKRTGYGAGSKDTKNFANVLKVMLCEQSENLAQKTQTMIETNIDDMSAEKLAFACENLLLGGALEAFCTPIVMKKGRCGVRLSVLCENSDAQQLKELVFTHTSVIGVREYLVQKTELLRQIKSVATNFGDVRVKISTHANTKKAKAEFDDISTLARKFGVSIDEIANIAEQKALQEQ